MNIILKKNLRNAIQQIALILLFCQGIVLPITGSAYADGNNYGWVDTKAKPVSHDAAVQYLSERAQQHITPLPFTTSVHTLAEDQQADFTTMLADLAHGLQNDPVLIFNYVHNHIDYVPYFGALKGPAVTLLEGSGNDFDQAALLIALLRHAGHSANYVFGSMTIPYAELANWLGVDNNPDLIWDLLASGGIPVTHDENVAHVSRLWVEATIEGTQYRLDPAWKKYTYTDGIDIAKAMGYDRQSFLNSVTKGATITPTSAQNLNTAGLAAELNTYTANLAKTIRSQHPNATVAEIIGGRTIEQQRVVDLPTQLPFPTSDEQQNDEVPLSYTTTIRIRHMGIDVTYPAPEIAGKRLTLTYDGEHRPNLNLDGAVIATGDALPTDDQQDLEILFDHPYPYNEGHYIDQGASNDPSFCDPDTLRCIAPYKVKRTGTYALLNTFGGTSDRLLAFRQQQLDQALEKGDPTDAEPVMGETLYLMGLTWMKETLMAEKLASELTAARSIRHHRMGLMSQEEGYSIDVKMQMTSTLAKDNTDKWDFFFTNNLTNSALEHGILEQMMGSNKPAASTIKLFDIANADGQAVYLANSETYESIKGSLQNYSLAEMLMFQNMIDAGHIFILPQNGQLVLGEWTGLAYIHRFQPSEQTTTINMVIGGGYHGGYGGSKGDVDPGAVNGSTQDGNNPDQNASTTPPVESAEPVDMATGAYLYDHTDLVLGANAPMPLGFHRSYTSASRLRRFGSDGFGYGWSHNYNIRLYEGADGNPGLGRRTPLDMAPMVAALRASLDLLETPDVLQSWMVSCLAIKWGVDQLNDNVVTIRMGNQNMPFVKLPDGTFVSPPGITATLTQADGTYTLKERFGTVSTFEKAPEKGYRITAYQDIDGNRIDFTYSGDQLTQVANNSGHTLTMNYDGERITSVAGSAGRTVSYAYTDNDLTGYTDPDGHTSTYGYDDGHRMTLLQNPLEITTAVNTYNSRSQVIHQTVPRQGGDEVTYNFYFSGFRNTEEDPDGQLLVSHFDAKGRVIARENKLGHGVTLAYDGQDHIVKLTDPRGNATTFTYDGHHNLVQATDALGRKSTLTHDELHRMTASIDALGNKVDIAYNDKHNPTATTIYPQADQPVTTKIAYLPNGLPEKVTDGRGTVSTLTYDNHGNPATQRIMEDKPVVTAYDPIGRLLSLTDQEDNRTAFEYNGRGQLTKRTDPFEKSTTHTYNADATIQSVTDRNGQTTTFAYTPARKLETITYPDDAKVTLTYDPHNQPVSMTDTMGTTTIVRDAAGRITAVTDANGNTISYRYDENGHTGLLTTIIYPGDKEVTYAYDELNRLATVTNWMSQTATYTYDEGGRLIKTVNFNGTQTTYAYDGAHRMTEITSTTADNGPIASFKYTLDANGNRINIDKQTPATAPLPKRNLSAKYLHNRLTKTDEAAYEYDEEGQLTGNGQIAYNFDGAHRLTGIGGNTKFAYDGNSNRLRAERDGATTHYIYDAGGNLLAEADKDNKITRYYIHGAGLLAAITPDDKVHCYHYDGIGSTIAITDSAAKVVNTYAYTPFGMILNADEAFAQPFKYVGQFGIMHESNGLYYMRARYYDPQVGRFISEDPIGFGGGDVNLYAYVQNNPVNFIDPNGLWSAWAGFSGVGAAGRGGNLGGGVAVELGKGGGWYTTAGRTGGLAGGVGIEVGGFTGSMDGNTKILTIGYGPWSIGVIVGDGIGVVAGYAHSIPFEASLSTNQTWFFPWDDNPK